MRTRYRKSCSAALVVASALVIGCHPARTPTDDAPHGTRVGASARTERTEEARRRRGSVRPPFGYSRPWGSPVVVTSSRIFAGPNKYPPTDFAAYGILAFRSLPSQYDRKSHLMFCHAYVSTLPHASEIHVPRARQMVTVWPLNSDEASDRFNDHNGAYHGSYRLPEDPCPAALDNYSLLIAQQALKEAELTGANLSAAGPFLLAWSPATVKGKEDALVLVSDLSDITTYEQAKERFVAWSRDIESDPALWKGGWNLERVKVRIRSWVDKYGERSLGLLGGE